MDAVKSSEVITPITRRSNTRNKRRVTRSMVLDENNMTLSSKNYQEINL